MAHDEQFRRLVIKYKDSGHTLAQVNEAFGVGSRSYYTWKAELEEKGKFENHYPQSRPGKTDPEKLRELAQKHPDWYVRKFAAACGVCFQAIDKRVKVLGITRKKNCYVLRKKGRETRGILTDRRAHTGKKSRIG